MTHDDALLKRSYRSRLAAENNWSDQVHWSTLFTWFANDGGFPGALLLVATFSFIWAVAWRDATLAGNDRAAIVFAFVLQMMFWLPANNQIMQSADSYLGFLVWIAFWLWGRRRWPRAAKALV